jgi:hypothetical protein
MDTDALLEDIADWLELMRQRYVQVAAASGAPTSQMIERPLFDPQTRKFWVEQHPVPISSLPRVPASTDPEGMAIANALIGYFGDNCEVWSPMPTGEHPAVTFREDAATWTYEHLLRAQLEAAYLLALSSLETTQRELARELGARLLDELAHSYLRSTTAILLGGLELEVSPLSSASVSLSVLSPAQLGSISRQMIAWQRTIAPDIGILPREFPRAPRERVILEVTSQHPRHSQPDYDSRLHRILLSFMLHDYPVHGSGHIVRYTWPSHGRLGGQLILPESGGSKRLSATDLGSIIELADSIPDPLLGQIHDKRGVALQRFMAGVAEKDPAEAVLDYTIAFEAVLLPEEFEGELKLRLRLGGALFIADKTEERRTLYQTLGKIYDIRSKIAHGLKPPTDNETREAATGAKEILRKLLLKCLRDKWPDQGTLTQLMLGGLS